MLTHHKPTGGPCVGSRANPSSLGPSSVSPSRSPNPSAAARTASASPAFASGADSSGLGPSSGSLSRSPNPPAEPASGDDSSGLGPSSGSLSRTPNLCGGAGTPCADPAKASGAKAAAVFRGPSKPLPGSRATTVQPAGLWHAWFGALSSSDCGLGVFFHSLRELPREEWQPSQHQRLWPMPLPYPELLVPGCPHRRADRLLNWLHLGQPNMGSP